MNDSIDRNYVVVCRYCEHYQRNELAARSELFETIWGICKKEGIRKYGEDEICEYFALKQGYHTDRWYPGKEEWQIQ